MTTKRKETVVEPEEVPAPLVLPDELLKVSDVMRIFGVCRTEVYYWMRGGMPSYKPGGRQRNLRFIKSELALWLQEQRVT